MPYAAFGEEIPVLLAPMSGVTDAPFRRQVARFGAKVAISEMIAGEDLAIGQRDALCRIKDHGGDCAFVVQLVGREPGSMEFGARSAVSAGADVIDINMGCPSRRVTGGLSGSALMQDLDRAEKLISAVLEGAQDRPVTLKMRLGWDHTSINAPELAKRAETLGVQLITVHGRTRNQFYKGEADWSAIADVVSAVSIPVVANGDILDQRTAKQALEASGATGLMVGRAATGKAWLVPELQFSLNQITSEVLVPALDERIDSLLEQASDSIALYGEHVGIRMVRKHLSAALDHMFEIDGVNENHTSTKTDACSSENYTDLKRALQSLITDGGARRAA